MSKQKTSIVGNEISYNAPATVSSFMESEAFVRFILGPVGSGKTTGCLFESLRRACEQQPGPDGIRRTRAVIVRNTLSQMKQTVLKDVETWLGSIAYFKASENLIQIRVGDVHSDWYLIPLDDPANQQRLLSLQLSWAWINEFIEVDPDLIPAIAGRLGRYPSAAQGGPTWFGIIGDSNMPNAGSRWHELLDVNKPEDWSVHIQPGGLSEGAENLNYLTQTNETLKLPLNHPKRLDQGREYYRRLARQHAGNWVKRYVHAQYGDDPDGTAVFRESFNRDFHVSKTPLEPSDSLPIIVAQDFGRNPCAVILQPNHRGQVLVLEEIEAQNMGLELHVAQNVRPLLSKPEYIGKSVIFVGDPSGVAKNSISELDMFAYLESQGFIAYPAPTNDIDLRIQAVESLLAQNIGGRPMLHIDGTRCPRLVQALHTKYLYAKRKDGENRSIPEKKHPWSDLVDALQYGALCVQGGFHQMLKRDIRRRLDGQVRARDPQMRIDAKGWT
jgi:hypothetical protein